MPDLVTFLVTAQARDMFYEHRIPVAHGHQIVQNQIRGNDLNTQAMQTSCLPSLESDRFGWHVNTVVAIHRIPKRLPLVLSCQPMRAE